MNKFAAFKGQRNLKTHGWGGGRTYKGRLILVPGITHICKGDKQRRPVFPREKDRLNK